MKKLNRIQSIAAAIILAVAVAIPVALAQSTDDGGRGQRGHKGHFGKRGGEGRIFGKLDLTDAQKAQMKQIRQNSREEMRPLMEQIRAKRLEIRQAQAGGTVDESLVRQKLTEIAPLEAKLMAERGRIHQEMLAVLTPEQRTKLEQLREQFKSKRGERGERKARKQTTTL